MFKREILLSVVLYLGTTQALTQCDIVKNAFTAMGGSFAWPAGTNGCCGQNGITCDTGNNVVRIAWDNMGLKNSIPSFVGLPQLHLLQLYDNQLTGSIPASLGQLTNLFWLKLRNNQLTGSIPRELGNLSKLLDLDLCGNNLSGTIPSELANLSQLNYLILHHNNLSGTIPPGIANLKVGFMSFKVNPLLKGYGPFPVYAFDVNQLANARAYPATYLKRQVTSTDSSFTTDALLQYCPISTLTIANKDQILVNCMAGLYKFCAGKTSDADIAGCQNKWEVIFSNSIYKFIYDACLPWKGATATGCQSALQTFYNVADAGLRDLQVGFAQHTINARLADASLAPCKSTQTCTRIRITTIV